MNGLHILFDYFLLLNNFLQYQIFQKPTIRYILFGIIFFVFTKIKPSTVQYNLSISLRCSTCTWYFFGVQGSCSSLSNMFKFSNILWYQVPHVSQKFLKYQVSSSINVRLYILFSWSQHKKYFQTLTYW